MISLALLTFKLRLPFVPEGIGSTERKHYKINSTRNFYNANVFHPMRMSFLIHILFVAALGKVTLSGKLFKIVFNSVIQTIYNIGDGVIILAFAYDVLIVADSQEKLVAVLDIFSTSCLDIELRININK